MAGFLGLKKVVVAAPEIVEEWPRRNGVQAAFLDDAFCLNVARAAGLVDETRTKKGDILKVTEHATRPSFAADGELVHIDVDAIRGRPITDDTKLYREVESHVGFIAACRAFERNGRDVTFSVYRRTATEKRMSAKNGDSISNQINEEEHVTVSVMIKPVLGDDYPLVIRAMQAAQLECWMNHNVLYCEEVAAAAVTEMQIREMMRDSGIILVTKAQITAVAVA
jgi:hypothetical protein